MKNHWRTEKDYLGEKNVPSHVYWGIHTARALDNFPFSGIPVSPRLIRAFAQVKKACALANAELAYLPADKSMAIIQACDEIIEGQWNDQFPVDALQGGAGTSTNMNVNEVIANRAIEIMGGTKGDYTIVSPLDDVNLHQSTNDTYPTALKIAAIQAFRELQEEIALVQGAFQRKEKEFSSIIKMGMTELVEAVPITLGAEFAAFAEAFARDRWRTAKCEERLRVTNLGGTAVGTGLTAPRDYIFQVTEKLREVTGLGLARAENLMDPTANADAFVEVSGILKAHASNLIKVANDLRHLHSRKEIELPKLQAGSSIMPSKINPVMMEAAIQVGLKVIANDLLVTEATSRGTFQINEFLPLLAMALLESLDLLTQLSPIMARHIDAIVANDKIAFQNLQNQATLITAFLPQLGYEKCGDLVKQFEKSGENSFEKFLRNKLGGDVVTKTLSPENLMSLGTNHHGKRT